MCAIGVILKLLLLRKKLTKGFRYYLLASIYLDKEVDYDYL